MPVDSRCCIDHRRVLAYEVMAVERMEEPDRPGIRLYLAAGSRMGDRIPASQVPDIGLLQVEEEVQSVVLQRCATEVSQSVSQNALHCRTVRLGDPHRSGTSERTGMAHGPWG